MLLFHTICFECLVFAVFMCANGRIDFRGLMQSVTKKDYMKYQLWINEKTNREMREEFARSGKNPGCYLTFIADMDELSMHQMSCKPGIVFGNKIFTIFNNSVLYASISHGLRNGADKDLRGQLPGKLAQDFCHQRLVLGCRCWNVLS